MKFILELHESTEIVAVSNYGNKISGETTEILGITSGRYQWTVFGFVFTSIHFNHNFLTDVDTQGREGLAHSPVICL